MHVPNINALFKVPEGMTKASLPAKPLFGFAIPPANDESILLGNRYLNKGDGAVLSSTSGMGKSALAIQLAEGWSLGEAPLGIRPARPLRSLIIQAEDSDGDIAEVTASIAHVAKRTPAQQAKASGNVVVVTDRVNRGARFLAQLNLLIAQHKPDLVIINPLQAFVDGDITASKDLGQFLREGLNALNEPPSFAYLLIHHTTKPATGKERAERQWHEVMYDMAGGAEIINWARAILSLRATPKEGEFNLVLAKRGRRAGVTKTVPHGVGTRLEPVTVIPLKHASGHLPSGQPVIYWEPRETADEQPPAKKGGGRPVTHLFDTYRTVFPAKASKGATINELARLCSTNKPIKANTLHDVAQRWANDGDVEIIREAGQPDRYRSAV